MIFFNYHLLLKFSLNEEIDDSLQKDLSSIPISDIVFPNMVYMIVHKNIELETKYLREYAEWEFLSEDELNRKQFKYLMI